MKSRFQPRLHYSRSSDPELVGKEIRNLPDLPAKTLAGLIAPFERKTSLETSVFGLSSSGTGLIRLVVRDQTLPGNVLRIGIFGGLEASGLEVVPHLSPYLESTLRRRKNLRTEIRTYPLSYPGVWFPSSGTARPSLLPELWSGSMLPDAYYLERELAVYRFNLVITLHRSPDENFRIETGSRVIRDDLLIPIRLAVLNKFPAETARFLHPALQAPSAPKLISESELGTRSLEIAIHAPPAANPRITAKILEELELQYPALLAYQAFI